ncbi:thiamine-phosphate kinase [Helicobacter saguini]|uniref:Thiamine-monophosphate kinase n=1 Tax=Helicobacter saguini TaxID=1548018 RepID=A0A347VW01_9HELI|nr:thiamine-phosphate kinase [Helicobacter saguini]MWV62219.1 thiamine-phosphate kinase [Helicobacter saguini]MWV67108.1 thiamine-phosphate kinase [Helicobacter saguini]MWV69458.1 thiamine-phosphate kinase [Helicobacter saguini]MWV70989.1 thiamine-phosphate kinase [Helicobacter saguini]TLD92927.1 thiamine-phosphate kinase [Helicobacter saguini]
MDIESFFLRNLKKSGIVGNIDDDCAILNFNTKKDSNIFKNKKNYIVSVDSFAQNTHFKLPKDSKNIESKIANNKLKTYTNFNQWLSYKNLSKKAFLVNISDILSSGGLAKYALLSITLPRHITTRQILEIIEGMREICRQYNIKIIGGDTASSDILSFHITLFGELNGKYLARNGVKNGDFVAYTSARRGDLGRSFRALKSLFRFGASVNKLPHNFLENNGSYSKFASPILRESFLLKVKNKLHSCMDISDGLGAEIRRLERLNRLHFLPFKPLKSAISQSGEEYELLLTFSPKNLLAIKRAAVQTRTGLHIIGKFGRFRESKMRTKIWHER